jgi:hypothetical protein
MENTTTENKKSFFQNDRRLVCGMLVFYGLCIIGVIAITFWGLMRRNQTISANATSTAAVAATQQAVITSTAIAHATELAQFEFIDHFDDSSGHWHVGTPPNRYWEGLLEIKDGVYAWEVDQVKAPFFHQVAFFQEFPIKDFDTYLDVKFPEDALNGTCGGLVFRRAFQGWNHGAYVFFICNDSTFNIAYYGEAGWEPISGRRVNKAILPADWNRLDMEARNNHFVFRVNNMDVYDLTDDRQTEGALGIMIELDHKEPTVIWFDNFGFQSR